MIYRFLIFYIFFCISFINAIADPIDLNDIRNFKYVHRDIALFPVKREQIFAQSQLPYLHYQPGIFFKNGFIPHFYTDNNIYGKLIVYNTSGDTLSVYFSPGFYSKYLHMYVQDLRTGAPPEPVIPQNQVLGTKMYGLLSVQPGDSLALYTHFHFIKSNINRFKPILIEKSFAPFWKDILYESNRPLNIFSFFAAGILMMMVLYSFAAYYQQKNREFLYYGLYALSMASMFFLKSFFLFEDFPIIHLYEEYIDFVCMIMGLIAYLAFFRLFINTAKNHRALDHLLVISQGFLWVMLIVFSIIYFFTNNYTILHYIENYLVKIILLLIGLVLMIYGFVKKEVLLKYLAIGNGLLIGFSFISLGLLMFGWEIFPRYPGSIFNRSMFWYVLGVILELICFLAGLVYKNRMELIIRVKEQEQLKRDNERKEFEKQMAVITATQHERDRISADMHDELGSGVTAIGLMTEIVKAKLKGITLPELEKISNSANELLTKMNTIIWSMKSSNDTIESLIAYIRSHTVEFLENTPIHLEIKTPVHIPVIEISGEKRGNIFLSTKEAINNIVKHSNATRVKITIAIENDHFIISIHDNGVGFDDIKIRRFGNGITNMKKRMEQLGGSMRITQEEGTIIIFEIPLKD